MINSRGVEVVTVPRRVMGNEQRRVTRLSSVALSCGDEVCYWEIPSPCRRFAA